MTSYITGAASLVEPGPDELFDYKIHCSSDNLYLADMPARTYLEPTLKPIASTLAYHSLRGSRRSICNG